MAKRPNLGNLVAPKGQPVSQAAPAEADQWLMPIRFHSGLLPSNTAG